MNEANTRLVETYGKMPERLRALLAQGPQEMWEFKTVPENWCIREVLHHITDAELNFSLRVRFALGEPGAPIHTFEQEAWGRGLHYAARPPQTALALFEALVQDTHGLLATLSDEDFEKTVQHPKRGAVNVAYLVGFSDFHLGKHLEQIQRRLNEWNARAK